MSESSDDFRPRLGRIRDQGRRPPASVLSHIRGARRGTGIRRATAGLSGQPGSARRVMVKARVVRIAGKGLALQRAHLSYLQRDGAGKDQERGEFYDRQEDSVEGRTFLERGRGDRHHFRLIVSAEDGQQLGDLKPFIRELMGQMEADLDTRLDWIAMDHHDTDNPHTHVIVRGVRGDGAELRLGRDYISRGIRERAGLILTRELGLEPLHELEAKLEGLTEAPRVTRMDRLLARRASETGEVDLGDIRRHQKQYQARLAYLQRHELARDLVGGRWQVSPELLRILGRMERQDLALERTRRALRAAGVERALARPFISGESPPLIGQVLASGLDEQTGKAWLVIDGADGKAHHAGLNGPSGLPEGTLVRVDGVQVETLDRRPLESQVRALGLTWLDRHLAGEDRSHVVRSGFGAVVSSAREERLTELERRGFIMGIDQPASPDAGTLQKLRWEGIHHEGRIEAGKTGFTYQPAAPGTTLKGTLEKVIDTPSGQLAMIADNYSLEFSLVPWQDDMKRHLHRGISMEVSNTMTLSRIQERSRGLGL